MALLGLGQGSGTVLKGSALSPRLALSSLFLKFKKPKMMMIMMMAMTTTTMMMMTMLMMADDTYI